MVDHAHNSRHGKPRLFAGADLVGALRLHARQAHGPLAVFPLLPSRENSLRYVTLGEAVSRGQAIVTEVNEGGSVPELRIVNKGDSRVLVLDGEELAGAKQNRVLNTSILVDKLATLVVPVSCTEQGRWSYESPVFRESEEVAERQVRFGMKATVNASLARGLGFEADQGRVWHEVDQLHRRHGTHSATHAMRDAYGERRADLDKVLAAFPLIEGQCGVLVLHGTHAVGLDLVSAPRAYAQLHQKLLRSYAFEALAGGGGEAGDEAVARDLLRRIAGLPGRRYKSPGLGWDVRFEGHGVVGSVLAYRGQAVHAAFFDGAGVEGAPGSQGGGVLAAREREWRIADPRERARRRQRRGR